MTPTRSLWEKRLGKKSTVFFFFFFLFFFFFPFCLKGVALPGLETSTSLQWGAPGPARRNSPGKVPAIVVGLGFLGRGGGTKVSRPQCYLGHGRQLWVPELQSPMPRPTCHSFSCRF